tara:strand:- start:100 stop:426 length:327 start_codon:yes stop_codon:yes gene_type:complete
MSTTRTKIKWEDATFKWESASGDGFTWDDCVLIQEVAAAIEAAHGDSELALKTLPEDKKKKLVRLIMKRNGVKVYDEYKEVKNIQTKVKDVAILIKEVKAKVELINGR